MTHKWFKEDEHVYYGYVKEEGAIKVIWISPEEMELRSPAEEARRWGGLECEDVNEDIALHLNGGTEEPNIKLFPNTTTPPTNPAA